MKPEGNAPDRPSDRLSVPSRDEPGRVRWHLVIPVKDAALAKSRLQTPPPLDRSDLARAVAQDTIEAACTAVGARSVTVVTSDGPTRSFVRSLGARVVPDPGAGLNAAVSAGWDQPLQDEGYDDRPVPETAGGGGRLGWAALLGDLPALRPEDLRDALTACAAHARAVVPDARGTGTVLLASTVAPPLPRFGDGSAARHGQDAVVLPLDLPRLRTDVDTAEDLRAALALGAGRHTMLAVRRGS